MHTPLITLVLSFYNEVDVLDELIDRLHAALKPLPIEYELLFINDTSTDGSLELLARRAESDPCIRVLTMSRNFGGARQGVCTVAGIANARGEAIIYMDTDLQDPPEVVPELIQAWLNGDNVDVVYTTRLSRQGESKVKMWITKLGYSILNRTTYVEIRPNSGDFKLISRRVGEHLMALRESRPFLRGMVPMVGYNQVRVHYDRQARAGGESHYPVFSARVINNFLFAIVSFSDLPMRMALWLGMALTGLAMLFGAYLVAALWAPFPVPNDAVLLFVISLIGGVQLAFLGFAGLYLCAVFDQVRHRPNWIVESTIGFDESDTVVRVG